MKLFNIWSNTEVYFKRYLCRTETLGRYCGLDYSPDICYFLSIFFFRCILFSAFLLWFIQNKLFTVIQYKKLYNTELYNIWLVPYFLLLIKLIAVADKSFNISFVTWIVQYVLLFFLTFPSYVGSIKLLVQ